MTGTIYIASKVLSGTGKEHLYLVYDADGDPSTTGDEQVIRGGSITSADIWIEDGQSMASSADNFGSGENYVTRNFTALNLGGADAATVWASMKADVQSLGTVDPSDSSIYETTIDYHLLGPNSNSTVATILYDRGFDITTTLPEVGGTGNTIPVGTFTGWNSFLGTSGNDSWTIDLNQGANRIVSDQGGNDTYTIDVSALASGHGELTIVEAGTPGSSNVLNLQNVDAADVAVYQTRDGKSLIVMANDKVVGWVPDQFAGGSHILDHVHVVPAVGSPTDIPVNNPTLPVFAPPPLPDPITTGLPLFGNGEAQASPLVIDLSSGHTGVTLTTFNASTTTTFFDIEGTGFATQTAWTSGDTGFLVRDLNGNGTIDNVGEMFGSPTVDGFTTCFNKAPCRFRTDLFPR